MERETLFVLFFPFSLSPLAINMWHNQVASLIQAKKSMKPETLSAQKMWPPSTVHQYSTFPLLLLFMSLTLANLLLLRQGPLCSMNLAVENGRPASRKGIPDLNMAPNNIAFLIGLIAHFLSSVRLFNIRESDVQGVVFQYVSQVIGAGYRKTCVTPGRIDEAWRSVCVRKSGIRETFTTIAH